MLKITRSRDRLIFNMGIPTTGKTVFLLRRGPGSWRVRPFRRAKPSWFERSRTVVVMVLCSFQLFLQGLLLKKTNLHFHITMPVIHHSHSLVSIIIRLICIMQSPRGRAMAQIWRPNIDQHLLDLNGLIVYHYNGNVFPKFSIWPGNLFQNYPFIKVSVL